MFELQCPVFCEVNSPIAVVDRPGKLVETAIQVREECGPVADQKGGDGVLQKRSGERAEISASCIGLVDPKHQTDRHQDVGNALLGSKQTTADAVHGGGEHRLELKNPCWHRKPLRSVRRQSLEQSLV